MNASYVLGKPMLNLLFWKNSGSWVEIKNALGQSVLEFIKILKISLEAYEISEIPVLDPCL